MLKRQRILGVATPCIWSVAAEQVQKPGNHPNFKKNALGVRRPFSELSEIGETLTATRKDRYRILRKFFPLPGWGNLCSTAQVTGFPANVSNPQGGKSTDFSAGKCHLLYFVVVSGSLRRVPGHSRSNSWNSETDFDTFISATDHRPLKEHTPHRTPCKRSTLSQFLVSFRSSSIQSDQKPTKIDSKLTRPSVSTRCLPPRKERVCG